MGTTGIQLHRRPEAYFSVKKPKCIRTFSQHIVKPICHWKLCSRWLPNASESDTNNMKSTWPTQEFCIGDPTRPVQGVIPTSTCLRWGLGLGETQILAFLDTSMLVSPTQNSGGIAQRGCFRVAVEYRLYFRNTLQLAFVHYINIQDIMLTWTPFLNI